MVAVDGVVCNEKLPFIEQIGFKGVSGRGIPWLNHQVGVRIIND